MSTVTALRRLACFVLLILIFVVAVWLRMAALQETVWLDELHTSWCVSSSFHEVGSRAMAGNQCPLYFWMVWPVYQGLGETAFALRLVSLVASLLLVVSIGWIVFRWTGSVFGTALAMSLASIDDKFLFYAVEARPYVVVQLAAVWQVALFARILFSNPMGDKSVGRASSRWRLMTFWLLTNILMWLHVTTIVLLTSESIIFLAIMIVRTKSVWIPIREFKYPLVPFVGILGLIIPGLIAIGLFRNQLPWDVFVDPRTFVLLTVADWIVCLAVPALAVFVFASHRGESSRWVFATMAVLFLSIASPVLVSMPGWVPLADYRYTISGATLVAICSGGLTGILARTRGQMLVAAMVICLAMATNPLLPGFIQTGQMPAQRIEDWEAVIDQVNADPVPICLYPNLVEDAQLELQSGSSVGHRQDEYHQFAVRGLYPLQRTPQTDDSVESRSLISPQPPSVEMMRRFEKAGGGWLLIRARRADAKRVLESLPTWFGSMRQIEYEDFSLPPLYLYRIRLLPASDAEPALEADNQ